MKNGLCSFSRSTFASFPYSSNFIHIFIILFILRSSVLEVNPISLPDDPSFLWSSGYREREWKLLHLRVTEQSDWPFHFEKLSMADTWSWETTYRFSNSLRSARIEFTVPARVYLLICLSEKPRIAWEKKKRDQFSWKIACVMLAYCDQRRLLSTEVHSGNEKCNIEYDRIAGIVYR